MREITASHVEVVTEARFEVAESPVWDVQRRSLVWVDIPRGTVHWFDKDAEIGTLELGQAVGAVGLRRRGGFVVAARDGFGIVDRSTELEIVAPVEADQIATRMNDGSCDSAGRFWAGTMAYDTRPGLGAVYRLGPDHAVTKVLDGVSVSNGICWDDKAGLMFYVDSGTGQLNMYDYEPESGSVSRPRVLAVVNSSEGLPDGIAQDAEGCIWMAIWGGSSVRRYRRDGTLDAVIRLPTSQITSCAFGGEQLTELYITSAWAGLNNQQRMQDPLAGAIFRVVLDIPGLPTSSFID